MIKKIFSGIGTLIIIAAVVFYIIGNKASHDSVSYNDQIITMDDKIIAAFEDLDAEFEKEKSPDLEKKRQAILALVEKSTTTVKALVPPQLGDEGFRDSMLAMFGLYKEWGEKDYKELVDIYNKESLTDADFDQVDKIYNRMTTAEKPLLDKAQAAQQAFAKKYLFKVER